ncbi:MAG: 2-phosphosulfolactate phosphatase [Anaerolineaceae bacterium]|nr:2-phosphosulfolactate phosphatase [Anaerolineaceae bacterium]MCB9099077.1 2-phosphosulfolactate phosphatase [Anaerolineales bacterium]
MTTIQLLDFVEGARQATGLTVVIDVFRAFSTACYLFDQGAKTVIPVGRRETARALQQQHPDYILIGERGGQKIPGFSYGNSPAEIDGVPFAGKTVVHTTTNGTQGLINAQAAAEVITGSFVNAGAIVAYIKAKEPDMVSLVAMGTGPGRPAEEDTACAHYLKTRLTNGQGPDFEAVKTNLRTSHTGLKFFDPRVEWADQRDFDLCLTLNKFNFVLLTQPYQNGLLSLRKIEVE